MNRALAKGFAGIVDEKRGRLEVSILGARVFFGYDKTTGQWRETHATCPVGVISDRQRKEAHGVINLFLYILA